jgi:hypothetical protein
MQARTAAYGAKSVPALAVGSDSPCDKGVT